MTLYEIDSAIMETFDAETGEILDSEKLNQLEMDRDTKITNIVRYIKNLEADAKILDEEAKQFKARKDSAQKKADSLRSYLEKYLNGETFESADKTAKITYRKSESVNVTDIWKIPEFLKKYTEPKADLVEIKKLIKAGEQIDGAEIVTSMNMQIK